MLQTNKICQSDLRVIGLVALLALLPLLGGCKSLMDPSVVGGWNDKPVKLLILDRLDIGDEPADAWPDAEDVQPEDLVAGTGEYEIGPGDMVSVSVFSLLVEGVETTYTRQVDPTGKVRLPTIGAVKTAGSTPSELEQRVAQIVGDKGLVVANAVVSVVVQQSRHKTFSILSDGTGPSSTFEIPINDFRVLDAMAIAGAVPTGTSKLYIIRRVKDDDAGPAEQGAAAVDELEQILAEQPEQTPPAEDDTGGTAEAGEAHKWDNVDGKWVKVAAPVPGAAPAAADGEPAPALTVVTRRILEIPYDKLLKGDMRYNVVIRPGDVIRVPSPITGNVYVGGQIRSPGTFALPGERKLTVKQLIFAANGFGEIAKPSKVELIRRIDDNHEVIVRIDVEAMFNGRAPDFFLKPNDMINVGTSPEHTLLALVRNGLRFSAGAGFIYDKNFNTSDDNNTR